MLVLHMIIEHGVDQPRPVAVAYESFCCLSLTAGSQENKRDNSRKNRIDRVLFAPWLVKGVLPRAQRSQCVYRPQGMRNGKNERSYVFEKNVYGVKGPEFCFRLYITLS